jgi:hypothetical protein
MPIKTGGATATTHGDPRPSVGDFFVAVASDRFLERSEL